MTAVWVRWQPLIVWENPGPELAKIIEVQRGAYLDKDDIIRLADVFNGTLQ